MFRVLLLLLVAALLLLTALMLCTMTETTEITLHRDDNGITVNVEGKLFTKYLLLSGNKPILWPIVGPSGKEMTRQYPMRDASSNEQADHPHHRSFWFAHGDVNGVSFWHESKGSGTIRHRKFVKVENNGTPTITTLNDWLGPDDKKICEDQRTLSFGATKNQRWIDATIVVRNSTQHVVKFGDTKEGSLGMRVAGSMKVDAKEGGKIINAAGETNSNTWGKASPWVDYHGPVEGETVGIAILNHPDSFRFPTHWHVRNYGLFAANPFGLHAFGHNKNANGSHTLKPGESFTLRYRVVFHRGDEQEAAIAKAFDAYSKEN